MNNRGETEGLSELKTVDIILPVYNEKDNIIPLVEEIHAVLAGLDYRYAIVLVDDGSDDGSADIIRRLSDKDDRIIGVFLRKNSGQTAAFAAGFEVSTGDYLVTMDADGQNDPADIAAMLEPLEEFDVAAGYRVNRADRPSRKLASRFANSVRNRVTGDNIIDTGCSLKAFRRNVVKNIPVFDGMHRFFPTLARMKGYRVQQVPTNHRPRQVGKTKYSNLGRLRKTVWDLWAVRWMQKRKLAYEIKEIKKRR